jgi:uncharacterized protein YbjT (DUF2867 family)
MILIAGAMTATSKSVVERLSSGGVPVRVLTRRSGGVGATGSSASVARSTHIEYGDAAEPASVSRALTGVSAVYVGGRRLTPARVTTSFLDAAYDAGVRRVVVASSSAVDDWAPSQPNPTAAGFYELEQRVRTSGLEWTLLRVELASADALRWAFDVPAQLRAGDVVRGPYAGAAGSPIHPADLADAVVAALLDAGHSRRTYALTGSTSLTHAEQIRLIGQVRSRTLIYQEIDPSTALARIDPTAPADLLMELWVRHVGRPAVITDAIETLTGHRQRTPWQWAADYPLEWPDAATTLRPTG